MQRYFIQKEYFNKDHVTITGDASKHIRRVMRMKNGDQIICCTEEGTCYVCELEDITDESVKGKLVKEELKNVELPIHVTIAHGLPKGDKFEWVIQKGTELGASQFIPFEAERSIVKWDERKSVRKLDRWNKIALEAAEQSHRQFLPTVSNVHSLTLFLKEFSRYDQVIVAYEEASKVDEKSQLFSVLNKMNVGNTLLFIVGPEGGFSDREIKLMEEHGAIICGLGPRILRSETAPLYGLAAISYHFELMG
ncbi:16S rRNA (uracil(1498)-N(3))-methyltransferase [Evansella sp. AB-P1]|uniref:16S rRNA (uracil(1498)-N(3))-methyltransferase n=1 Tax=Evansella sp. AB-P1 TaxID=3037653 RepID=UPI00241E35D7|nr:16S rRNA (uracil(1498)-N(3))-methyltransferase [Evansella sp. AB-P1]MDG5786536.1 16S rRNA (uracil(1498)-N(3))-methyltransferase [Evansella sp. AB-P1]